MISFIVTTYNLADWLLRRCLTSIVAQGLARDEYEIIVVDDESTVSPRHVVDEFATQVNITLHIQRHKRQGAARNLALCHAQGDWVQFVDGDDYLFEGTISPLLHIAEKNNLDLLMFGFREVHDDSVKRIRIENNCSFNISTGDDYMLHHNLLGSCCMLMFKRSLLDDSQYDAPLRFTEGIYIEDEEFATKLVWRAQRMAKIDTVVYAYYQRAGSTVHSRSHEHTDELFRNYIVVLERLLHFESSLGDNTHDGFTRKVRTLAVDVLRRSLREPDWKERWMDSVHQLRSLGVYPLPAVHYSMKYSVFRFLTMCAVGRRILHWIEKSQNRL